MRTRGGGRFFRPRMASKRGAGRSRGQSLVEFAVVVPLMLFLVVAIGDFGRLYAAAIAVESAVREAADYGAFLGSPAWDESNPSQIAANVAEMERRACTAASTVPGYEEPPGTIDHATCTNPSFSWSKERVPGSGNCRDQVPVGGSIPDPCIIHANLRYTFQTILQLPIVPTTLTFERESRFPISDLAS